MNATPVAAGICAPRLTNVSLVTLVVVMSFRSLPRFKLNCGNMHRILIVGLWHVFPVSVCQCELLYGLIKHKTLQRGGMSSLSDILWCLNISNMERLAQWGHGDIKRAFFYFMVP